MKIAELMKISMEMLKMMSKCGIKTDDWQHLEMLEEYHSMRENCEKFRYIMAYLSEKYKTEREYGEAHYQKAFG